MKSMGNANNRDVRRVYGGVLRKKVLLLLLGGLGLGLARSSRQYFRVTREIAAEWKKIDRDALNQCVKQMHAAKLVRVSPQKKGGSILALTDKGKNLARRYDLENIQIATPKEWDKKWRMVMFDVPESRKKVREALRMHLRSMGFVELQKSVFVHPYQCFKEIEYIADFYFARTFVRLITATEIDNERVLKKHFRIK